MNAPRKIITEAHEALMAGLFSDAQTLLDRTELLRTEIDQAATELKSVASVLRGAGDDYRKTLNEFTRDAQKELTEYLEKRTGAIAKKTSDEMIAIIQLSAKTAFESEAAAKTDTLGKAIIEASRTLQRKQSSKLAETFLVSLASSAITAGTIIAYFRWFQ